MNKTDLTQLCKSIGLSETVSSIISSDKHVVAFLRPWRREKFYWENLDTQNESRLLAQSKLQWLKSLAKQVPEFEATVEWVLQKYPQTKEPDFFRALILRRIEKNKSELTLRAELLKHYLENDSVTKILRVKYKPSVSSSFTTAHYGEILDPPGLQLLVPSDHWEAAGRSLRERLAEVGLKVVQEQQILAKWEFDDEKNANSKQQELGDSANLVRLTSNSQRVNPCLPSNNGVGSWLLPILVKAPIGSDFKKAQEPGVYQMITPERFCVEKEYKLIDIESKASKP